MEEVVIIRTKTGVAIKIDRDSLSIVSGRSVYLDGKGYPSVWGQRKNLRLHRLVMAEAADFEVDHINGDVLDCRRENLRVCTRAENMRNRGPRKNNKSGFKGVAPSGKRWRAAVNLGKKQIYLGTFDTAEEAARAHDMAVLDIHKEFAWTNGGNNEA